ncbi:hypothetical protein SKPI104516_02550 [Skermania piniformis]
MVHGSSLLLDLDGIDVAGVERLDDGVRLVTATTSPGHFRAPISTHQCHC